MALFKKSPLSQKSSPSKGGLFKPAKTAQPAKRYGGAATTPPAAYPAVPAAGFPTSEDERHGGGNQAADQEHLDADSRFLHYGEAMDVVSSNVASLRYQGNTLHITYLNGGEYHCDGVDPMTAIGILHAPSVGRALNNLEMARGKFTKS